MIAKRPEPTVISATDPGLSVVARLGADVVATRDWVATVLGDLATDNENDARLRETLRVFLGCGSSYKAAAEELNLHFNSVKYRVGRAIARRALDPNSTTVCLYDLAADRQTGSGSLILFLRVQPSKQLKDRSVKLGLNPDAIVLNP